MENTSLTRANPNRSLESMGDAPMLSPDVDIFENKDEYLVIADVPGATLDLIRVDLEKGELLLDAEIKGASQGAAASSREFTLARYRRRFSVPNVIDESKVSADLKNGVLTMHLPKSDAVKPKRIAIKAK